MTFSHIYDLRTELYVNIYQVGVVTVCMCSQWSVISIFACWDGLRVGRPGMDGILIATKMS